MIIVECISYVVYMFAMHVLTAADLRLDADTQPKSEATGEDIR